MMISAPREIFANMTAGDFDGDGADEAAVDFGSLGAWMWNAGAWTQLTASDPEGMVTVDVDGIGEKELVMDMGPLGLWLWDSGVWTQLSANNPD